MDSTNPNAFVVGANDVRLEAGHTVGEYEIDAKIGEGGFGDVFKAVHPLIGKVVAIKLLHRRYSAQPEMVSRFIAEARAVNQIRHRHIIDIFAFGQLEDGRHYYVMEYLEGMSLEEYIARRGRLDLAESIPILRALARALDAAHAKGIAHRDLKPENVFMVTDEDGNVEPKLLDFGIAKLLSEDAPQEHKTRTGAPLGTPHYMSPEQCRGRGVDHRTDIYGFGIMVYRMLTGTLPFEGDDYMEILLAQIGLEPAPPSSLLPSLPPTVDQAIGWMLRKEPAERPPNLVTAVRSLEDAAASAGIAVAPSSTSAAHAVLTSPVAAQRTPPSIRSLDDAVPAITGNRVSIPDLFAAASMSARLDAPVPQLRRKGPSKLLVAFLGIVGAMVAGGGAYWALSRYAPGQDRVAATRAQAAEPGDREAAAPAGQPAVVAEDVHAGAPDADPEPRFVTFTIDGPPAGTEVYGPQGLLGVVPGKIQLLRSEEPVLLTFKADAHRAKTREVVPLDDGAIELELERKIQRPVRAKRKRSAPKRRKRDPERRTSDTKRRKIDTIEDPF